MLTKLVSHLPQGFSTKCTTAQHKSVQSHSHDIPKSFWCCWVTDDSGNKFFAMYDDGKNEVKLLSEEAKKNYIIKPFKA
jgi:L-ascorbate metabolism protein UlaG (beta-lactamase superfamily)